MRLRTTILMAVSCILLAACGPTRDDDIRAWMSGLRSTTRPVVTPLAEPKKFVPEPYTQTSDADPFSQSKLTTALRRESTQLASNAALIAPEMARRKQPLEAYPLDAIAMVGSLHKGTTPVALLMVDKLLYQVRVGDYIGQNYGKILRIADNAVHLREIVQDATGDWIERSVALDLQEGKK